MRLPSEIYALSDSETVAELKFDRAELQRRLRLRLLQLGVECRVDEDAVTLSGTVSSYYEKQLAQEIVMRFERSLCVKNQCVVEKNERQSNPR